jgi:hypothetical protein
MILSIPGRGINSYRLVEENSQPAKSVTIRSVKPQPTKSRLGKRARKSRSDSDQWKYSDSLNTGNGGGSGFSYGGFQAPQT